MKKLMCSEDKQKLADAIALAEKNTSGEIVPVVVRRSDSYPETAWRFGFCFALIALFILYMARPHLDPLVYLTIEIPLLLIGVIMGSLSPIQRFFLNNQRMNEEVQQRAIESFHVLGLNKTKHRTGILIFISMLERRAVVLADVGISEKVSANTWDELIKKLILQIKAGHLADGVCDAVAECGRILSQHFPIHNDDANELPNQPHVDD